MSGTYLDTCEKLEDVALPWAAAGSLTKKRAFAAAAVVPKESTGTEVLYIMGGYNSDDSDQFLSSAEQYDSTADTWSAAPAVMDLREEKSHFCLVMASPVRAWTPTLFYMS